MPLIYTKREGTNVCMCLPFCILFDIGECGSNNVFLLSFDVVGGLVPGGAALEYK